MSSFRIGFLILGLSVLSVAFAVSSRADEPGAAVPPSTGSSARVVTAGKLPATKGAIVSSSTGVACLSCPAPDYSFAAANRGVHGVVDLELTVSEDGRVENVKVLAAPCDELKEAAVKAAQDWTFTPAMRDGKPIREVVQVPVVFRLFQPHARFAGYKRGSRETPATTPKAPPAKTL